MTSFIDKLGSFDVITFTFSFVQSNAFLLLVTAGTSVASILYDVWLLGLLIFEYDKDNLVLDQVTREAVLPEGVDGPQSSEDVFPSREWDE